VKRTTELNVAVNSLFSRPLHGLPSASRRHPALKRWAIFIQSASRTVARILLGQSPVCGSPLLTEKADQTVCFTVYSATNCHKKLPAGVLLVETQKSYAGEKQQMKKSALLIAAVLTLAAATMGDSRMRIVHRHISFAHQTLLVDPVQKPRGDELTEEFHQTYALTPTGRVSIANINGDVHISAWDRNEVKVDAVKRAYSPQRLSEVTIEVTNTADSVMIKTKYAERNQNFETRNRENNSASVEYTLTVPSGSRLDGAELVNGSLDVEGVQGDVHASLVNGQVKAGGLGGEVKLSTVNGGVEANVARLDAAKGVTLNSVNGSIVLIVPAGANAQIRASTVHGPITNDFGLAVEDGQYVGHNLSGQIGSGGPRIRLNNVNGSITIKRGGSAM